MPKKKPEKSLDELLEEALVKEDEEPYEVPENWVWTRPTSLAEQLRGVTYKKKDASGQPEEDKSLILRAGNLQKGEFITDHDCVYVANDLISNIQQLRVGDVVVAGSSGSKSIVGKAAQVKKATPNTSFGAFLTLFRPNNLINSKYYGWFFQSKYYRDKISMLSVGININNIKREHFESLYFPLPPLLEQKRIVKKLSSMLGRLKEARELIQEARDTFEKRRAAILNKAFTGELTKKWREENPDLESASMLLKELRGEKKSPIRKNRTKENMPHTDISYLPPLPTKWEWAIVGEISDKIHYGYTAKSESDPIGPKLLRITDIQNDTVDWNIVPYCKIDENQKSPKYFLREGNLVFARTGATVGKSYLLSGKFPESVFASYLIRIIINERVSNRYISNFFKSLSYWRQITSGQVGIGQPNVNAQTLSRIILPLPPLPEQKEIVRILENLLDHENEAKALIDIEEHIDLLEKSILLKAFCGELGTNDTNDEPAIELLKRSLKEKNE